MLKKLKPVFNLEFRNCLMHYSFKNDDGFLIKKEYFDVNEEFFGLVESCFNGMTFDEFIVNVNDNLKTMSEKIQEFCAVELKHLDFFDKSY